MTQTFPVSFPGGNEGTGGENPFRAFSAQNWKFSLPQATALFVSLFGFESGRSRVQNKNRNAEAAGETFEKFRVITVRGSRAIRDN